MNTRRLVIAFLALIALTGCAQVKPPPEPDMSKLVPANRIIPEELQGRVASQSPTTKSVGGNSR